MNTSLRDPDPLIGHTGTILPACHLVRAVIGGVLMAALSVSPAFAQSSPGTWNGLSDRFQIDTGYFRITADTVLALQRRPGLRGHRLREGPRRRRERGHVLAGRDLAGRAGATS